MTKKVVLITGASSGIGFESAKVLLEQGHIVYGGARRTELLKNLEKLGVKTMYLDVTDQATLDAAVEQIVKEQGRLDVVFANAGYAQQGPLECVDIEDAKAQFDVNVFGFGRTIKSALPQMRKQKSGLVIVTSSAAGSVTMPAMAWYPATKHAIDALAGGLRMEMKNFGINVAIVEPGYVDTPFSGPALKTLEKVEKNPLDAEYARQMAALRAGFGKAVNEDGGKVSEITNLVQKAVNARNPKRYYTATQAKLAKFLKRAFGYGLLDSFMINSTIK